MKNQNLQVDVYDLQEQTDKSTQMTIGFKQKVDQGTDPYKQLLAGRDWFFADINREILRENQVDYDFSEYDQQRPLLMQT